jgi:hypothetical protein
MLHLENFFFLSWSLLLSYRLLVFEAGSLLLVILLSVEKVQDVVLVEFPDVYQWTG